MCVLKDGNQYVNKGQLWWNCVIIILFFLLSIIQHIFTEHLLYAKHTSLCLSSFLNFSTIIQLLCISFVKRKP